MPPPPPPPAYPGHLTPLPSRGGGNLIISLSGGGEFELHPRFPRFGVASYVRRGVRGFSWERLYLCGQLVTRKGFKQALICGVFEVFKF